MLALAILLLISGLIFTFSLGMAGYVVGPLTMIGGGLLLRHERRRRREFTASAAAVPRRAGWQRFLIGTGAVVVAFCGLFALVWQLTAGLADTAHEFFLALKSGDIAKARTYLAEDFRASTSDDELRRFVEKSALANYESASWTTRSIQNSSGELAGTVNTASGGSIPMSISLVQENGGWKILSLRKPDAGILTDDPRPQPNTSEQRRLANETTAKFTDAVTRQDFTQFHASVAGLWRKQITVEQLKDAFKSFNAAGIDLRHLNGDPKITASEFDEDGAFVIAGTYPHETSTFTFRYRYIYEAVDWKVVGVSANLK